MSRSNQADILENPCSKFLSWKTIKETVIVDGDEVEKMKGGSFVYYDKATEEKIAVKLPLKFAILNKDLVSFKGYDEANKRGVWSNEVNHKDQIVSLRSKEGKIVEFKRSEYKAVKEKLASHGAKFTQSVYIAVDVNGKWEIWNLQLSGGSLSGAPNDMGNMTPEEKEEGWFNFTNGNKGKLYSNFIEVNTFKPKKKGATKFTIPVYSLGEEIDEKTSKELNDLDGQLNEYLAYYLKKPVAEIEAEKANVPTEKEDVTDY